MPENYRLEAAGTLERTCRVRRKRMFSLLLLIGSIVTVENASAEPRMVTIPAPPTRPLDSTGAETTPPATALPQSACMTSLLVAGHQVEHAIQQPAAMETCLIVDPVRISVIRNGTGSPVRLPDRPVLSCATAQEFAAFLTTTVSPLAESLMKSGLQTVGTGPGFDCRGRNRAAGGKTSAHGLGQALDISALTLADGRTITVAKPVDASSRQFLIAVRKAACGWFTTVLGPGSDAAHADHLHVDIEPHGTSRNYRVCQ